MDTTTPLPSGTVPCLFAHIEGSTRLRERPEPGQKDRLWFPEAMTSRCIENSRTFTPVPGVKRVRRTRLRSAGFHPEQPARPRGVPQAVVVGTAPY
jgi:hypothetical protein